MKQKIFLLFSLLSGVLCMSESLAQKRLQYLATQTSDHVATVYLVYLDHTPTEWDGKPVVEHKDYTPSSEEPMGGLTTINQPRYLMVDASTQEYAGSTTSYLFYQFTEITAIKDLHYLNTSNVTDMNHMFARCVNLLAADISTFNTSKVTTMERMFASCNRIATLTIGALDLSSMTQLGLYQFVHDCAFLSCLDFTKITNYPIGALEELVESQHDTTPFCLIYYPVGATLIDHISHLNVITTTDGVNFQCESYFLMDDMFYADNRFDESLFVKAEPCIPYPFTAKIAEATRVLNGTAGRLYTWFMPFELPIPLGVEAYEFDPIATGETVIAFKPTTDAKLQPLKPYLLRATGAVAKITALVEYSDGPVRVEAYQPGNDVATEASASG